MKPWEHLDGLGMSGRGPAVSKRTGAGDQTSLLTSCRFTEENCTAVEDDGDRRSIHTRWFTRQKAEG